MLSFELKRAGISPKTLKAEEQRLKKLARKEELIVKDIQQELWIVPAKRLELAQRRELRERLLQKAARRKTLRQNLKTLAANRSNEF